MKRRCFPITLAFALLAPGWPAFAQSPAVPATNQAAQIASLSPPPPMLVSPVSFFRELLVLSPAERAKRLAGRTPENRERVLAKIREYRALGPDECELRLQATELRWYLTRFLSLPATDRPAQLALVPTNLQPLVSDRLAQWDKLPPDWRGELLTNEEALHLVTRPEAAAPTSARLQALSTEQRRRAVALLDELCTLTDAEKAKALKNLSDAERREIEKTLQTFAALPADQRARCLRAYEQFTGMAAADKREFLKNAEKWEAMSPAERQNWRNLVNAMKLTPPLPNGLDGSTPAPPPNPRPRSSRPAFVTNN